MLEDRGRPHDVQVRILLAGEGRRRQVLRRGAGPDSTGGLLAEAGERAGDRRRQIVGDGNPFHDPADLRADRSDGLPVVRPQSRQPVKPVVHRRLRHDPLEGEGRHTEAWRHAEAFDPRQLTKVRALASDDGDLRPVDLLKAQHVGQFASPILGVPARDGRLCGTPPLLWQAHGRGICWQWQGARSLPLPFSPPAADSGWFGALSTSMRPAGREGWPPPQTNEPSRSWYSDGRSSPLSFSRSSSRPGRPWSGRRYRAAVLAALTVGTMAVLRVHVAEAVPSPSGSAGTIQTMGGVTRDF